MSPMKLGPYDTVRIRNLDAVDWVGQWNGQKYRCASGSEALVPFAGICLWFGHPESQDVPNDPKQRYRTDEFQRLCVKYGVYENHDQFPYITPNIEVYDLEGERIITVIDDPDGKQMAPYSMTEQENLDLRGQLASLQRQMQVLTQQIAAQDRGNAAVAQSPNVTDDTPLSSLDPFYPQPSPSATPAGGNPLIPSPGSGSGGPPVPAGYGAPIDDDGNEITPRSETVLPPPEPEVEEDTPRRVRVSS